jgi:hypothetical protein
MSINSIFPQLAPPITPVTGVPTPNVTPPGVNLGTGGTSSSLTPGGGVIGPIAMAPEVRQALTQILSMLQALAATMAPSGNAGTGGTAGTNGLNLNIATPPPAFGTGGTAIGTGGTSIPSIGTGGTTNPAISNFAGFSGVSGLNITGLPPVPQLAVAPTSFFTPIASPQATPPPTVIAPPVATTPQAKIPLTSGAELQQRIQLFNQSNPNNVAGLAQFLTNSYSNTSVFTPQADGTLLYTVNGGAAFKIAATGLTPRVPA